MQLVLVTLGIAAITYVVLYNLVFNNLAWKKIKVLNSKIYDRRHEVGAVVIMIAFSVIAITKGVLG